MVFSIMVMVSIQNISLISMNNVTQTEMEKSLNVNSMTALLNGKMKEELKNVQNTDNSSVITLGVKTNVQVLGDVL